MYDVIVIGGSYAGLAATWGTRAFFCPYCDGYEFDLGHLGILGPTDYALLVAEWAGIGRATYFLNGAVEPDSEQLAALVSRQIAIERERVLSVDGDEHIVKLHLADGRTHTANGLFLTPRARLVGPFAEQLGCQLEMARLGPIYKTDPMKETTVAGVFACGDAALPSAAVSYAVADGVRAGVSAHQSLIYR